MATGMHLDERSVDCLVLCHHNQVRKVSPQSMTMHDTTFKWLQRIALNFISNRGPNHAINDCEKYMKDSLRIYFSILKV